MNWLLRTSRPLEFSAAVLGTALLVGLLHGHTAPVPSLAAGRLSPVPVAAVLGALPVVAVLRAWSGLPADMAAVAVRRLWAWQLTLVVAAATTTLLVAAAVGGPGAGLEATRNLAGLWGLAVIGLRVSSTPGGLTLPLGYLLCAFLIGRGQAAPVAAGWAWVLRDGGDGLSQVLAVALFLAGALLLPGLPRRMAFEDGEAAA